MRGAAAISAQREWLPWTAGGVAAVYSSIAWLAVEPNQDLLADGIQVQKLLKEPQLVLSFPGQKHGGTLEYIYALASENFLPGSYLAHSLIRVVLAFFTAWLAAKLFRTLFPAAPNWAFLLAVVSGPSVLQGLAGPPSNPVGVYWLTPTYDLSWLFVVLGSWLWAREVSRERLTNPRPLMVGAAGIFLGLGVYQQPTIVMLLAPVAFLVIARSRWDSRTLIILGAGGLVGLAPAIVNYFIHDTVNTWDPSHFPVFQPTLALAVLGLDGIPSYFYAVLPYSWGMAPSEESHVSLAQSVFTGTVLLFVGVVAVWACFCALRYRRRLSAGGSLAVAWMIAAVAIEAFALVVDPVWFYGASLAVLLWISLGALPSVAPRPWGTALTVVVLAVVAISTLAHNAYWLVELPTRIEQKWTREQQLRESADMLVARDVMYVYGSYYDSIPISYGSGGRIHPVTSTYNRFPLDIGELGGATEVLVAVNEEPGDLWGEESLARVVRDCFDVSSVTTRHPDFSSIGIYSCPTSVLTDPTNTE